MHRYIVQLQATTGAIKRVVIEATSTIEAMHIANHRRLYAGWTAVAACQQDIAYK